MLFQVNAYLCKSIDKSLELHFFLSLYDSARYYDLVLLGKIVPTSQNNPYLLLTNSTKKPERRWTVHTHVRPFDSAHDC